MNLYGCQQNLIHPSHELKAILEFICAESHKLTNCGIYYARQFYFKTGKLIVQEAGGRRQRAEGTHV
jgi:hypothetical protein